MLNHFNDRFIKEATMINLCPHPLIICDRGGNELIRFPRCKNPPRVNINNKEVGYINGVIINKAMFLSCKGMPPVKENTYYIVPTLIAQQYQRDDLLCPGELIRGFKGEVLGCLSLRSFTM